ncbi:MAG TPA: hypothetical protein VFT66_26625, partial [Roseiflexaceae bacterium]|nr:hypothetical protein [Roseiflexaceae bacterium]
MAMWRNVPSRRSGRNRILTLVLLLISAALPMNHSLQAAAPTATPLLKARLARLATLPVTQPSAPISWSLDDGLVEHMRRSQLPVAHSWPKDIPRGRESVPDVRPEQDGLDSLGGYSFIANYPGGPLANDYVTGQFAQMFSDPLKGVSVPVAGCGQNLIVCRPGGQQQVIASALLGFNDDYWASTLQSAFTGGYGNQFAGQLSWPQPSTITFQQPDYAGAVFNNALNDPILQTALGYNDTSSLNFGAFALQNINNYLYQPSSQPNFSFGGLFTQGAKQLRPSSAHATPADDIEQRYFNLGQDQIAIYYDTEDLSTLRSEWNTVIFSRLYFDPAYLAINYR